MDCQIISMEEWLLMLGMILVVVLMMMIIALITAHINDKIIKDSLK